MSEKRPTMTRLLLIRHGETDWNVEGRYQGQADPPLNARGLAQAQALAKQLQAQGPHPTVVYASPLRRAWQTAILVAQAVHAPLKADPRLKEIHLGAWEGVLATEIARRWPALFQAWETAPWQTRPPGGETIAEVQRRVYAAVDDIVARHPHETVAIVAHRLPIALLKIRYQGYDPSEVRRIPVANAQYEILEVPPEGPSPLQG